VGFDIVELCPDGINKQSEFLAAKLYYKMLSYKFSQYNEVEDKDDFQQEKENPFNKLNKFKKAEDDDQ
jgi:agmatinase